MTIHIDGTEAVTLKQIAEALNTSVNALAIKKSRGRVTLTCVGTINGENFYDKADIARLRTVAKRGDA